MRNGGKKMTDYEKMKKLYDQMDSLSDVSMTLDQFRKQFYPWFMEVVRFFHNKYGENSPEKTTFFTIVDMYTDNPKHIGQNDFRLKMQERMLPFIKQTWEPILEELKEEQPVNKSNNVFIVHGHDEKLKYRISDLLRKIRLNPIILHQQANSSRTIIEKIEKFGSEASAAIVLFTPDDFGNVKTEQEAKSRARQNVVFEAGYFMGLLGRDKTLLIVSDKTIELPGDLSGVIYSEVSELDIAKELKAMGLPVDLNDLLNP